MRVLVFSRNGKNEWLDLSAAKNHSGDGAEMEFWASFMLSLICSGEGVIPSAQAAPS